MSLLLGEPSFFSVATFISFLLLSLSLVLVFIRLARGPSLADRVIALDLTAFVAVTFISLYCIATGEQAFLDAAVALALIAFLGTLAFARFLTAQENGGRHD